MTHARFSVVGSRGKPFTSTQRAVVHHPAFLWNGTDAMTPGLAARVHDSCIAALGALHAMLLGLFTVADVHGGVRRASVVCAFNCVAARKALLLGDSERPTVRLSEARRAFCCV